MSDENNDESTPSIEYKNYPRSLGFYSAKHDKIYITSVAKNYPRVHKYLKEHETKHYYYNKKSPILSFIFNLYLDWIDSAKCLNPWFTCEWLKCEKEFSKIIFSDEEINNFKKEFLPPTFSRDWYVSKLYENLRIDGYFMGSLIFYLILNNILKNIIHSLILTIIIMSYNFYIRNRFEIKNIFRKLRN